MVIASIVGGLGNQMFQYATARALAQKNNQSLKLDISAFAKYQLHQGFELKRIFNIPAGLASQDDIKHILGWQANSLIRRIVLKPSMNSVRMKSLVTEPTFNHWSGLYDAPKECYLMGYWQSEKYFIDIEKQLRADFQFRLALSAENTKTVAKIDAVNGVSVHIRRGDYVSNQKNNSIYSVCSPDYYSAAVSYIATHVDDPYFFIFSDDIEWCKNNFKMDFPHQYINHNQDSESYNDMRLMSLCKHHIIANSSFSWWGAWLNPNEHKIVIAPQNWFINKKDDFDLIPEKWIKL